MGQKYLNAYAICYTSKNLTPEELNYTVTENEFLVVVHAINKFKHYIIGYENFIQRDHYAIIYLVNKSFTHGRITIWLLLFQEFNITILDWPGKQNTIAEFLFRIKNDNNVTLVEDSFRDEYFFLGYSDT